MRRAGYNPVRRNRNIGTAKQGHGQNNRLVIPDRLRSDRNWRELLNKHQLVTRTVGGRTFNFIVEDNRLGCVHACSVDDMCRVLSHIPPADLEGLDTLVLRQPTRKQRALSPVWGRLIYSADLGYPGRKSLSFGPTVFIEARDPEKTLDWSTSLDPDRQLELDRLRRDGHVIEQVGGRHVFHITLANIRATQLYRTLIHEIGHWVDWLEKVERPTEQGGDYEALMDAYFSRPSKEREAFAHRYADETRERLMR